MARAREVLRQPLIPMEFTEENKVIASHNEILIDKEDMLWIKRHNDQTGEDEWTPLWKIALAMLGGQVQRLMGFVDTKEELSTLTFEKDDLRPGDVYIVRMDESLQAENNKFIEYMYIEKDGECMWEIMGQTLEEVRSMIDIRRDDPVNPKDGYCWIKIDK